MSLKILRSITIVLIVVGVAIAGLFVVIGGLPQSQTTSPGRNNINASPTITSLSLTPTEQTTTHSLNTPTKTPSLITSTTEPPIATVNGEAITDSAWQQATQLDQVMSQLAGQPAPTAEETLDRLINEIIVLQAVTTPPAIADSAVTAKVAALQSSWQVDDQRLRLALQEAGLNQDALTERVRRLLQVEATLTDLAAQQPDLNTWLADVRAEAAIGLYSPIAQQTQAVAISRTLSFNDELIDEADSINEATRLAPPSDMPIGPYPGNVAPDFTATMLDGTSLTLSALRGQPVLINFWASWCPPCRRELPALQTAYDKYGSDMGFIAVDVKESTQTVSDFVAQLGLTFPVALDPSGQISDLNYQVRGLPTTIFVDATGVVAYRHVGPLDEAQIDEYVQPLLTAPVVEPPTEETLTTAPDFSLLAADGQTVSLQDYRGENSVILVFYRGHT